MALPRTFEPQSRPRPVSGTLTPHAHLKDVAGKALQAGRWPFTEDQPVLTGREAQQSLDARPLVPGSYIGEVGQCTRCGKANSIGLPCLECGTVTWK